MGWVLGPQDPCHKIRVCALERKIKLAHVHTEAEAGGRRGASRELRQPSAGRAYGRWGLREWKADQRKVRDREQEHARPFGLFRFFLGFEENASCSQMLWLRVPCRRAGD